jgi:hypothetical protein
VLALAGERDELRRADPLVVADHDVRVLQARGRAHRA